MDRRTSSVPIGILVAVLLMVAARIWNAHPVPNVDDPAPAHPQAPAPPPADRFPPSPSVPPDQASSPPESPPASDDGRPSFTGQVVYVADGDSFTMRYRDQEVRVRLYGIDAPERGQAYSQRARQALSDRILDRRVTVEVVDTDRYGRTVGRVRVGGVEVNGEMVEQGYAWSYKWHDVYPQREAQARRAKRGLWRDPHPQPPWDYRRANPRE